MSEYKINGITCRAAFTVSREPGTSHPRDYIYKFCDMTLKPIPKPLKLEI